MTTLDLKTQENYLHNDKYWSDLIRDLKKDLRHFNIKFGEIAISLVNKENDKDGEHYSIDFEVSLEDFCVMKTELDFGKRRYFVKLTGPKSTTFFGCKNFDRREFSQELYLRLLQETTHAKNLQIISKRKEIIDNLSDELKFKVDSFFISEEPNSREEDMLEALSEMQSSNRLILKLIKMKLAK